MARTAKAKANGRGGGFEQSFNALDKVLRTEDGQTTELDYTEQTSWMLFLKYLDDLETRRQVEAELKGQTYSSIIDDAHRWGAWAAPKTATGVFDHDRALTGDDLIAYVNTELWPYLRGFRERAAGPDTIEYKIGEVFAEIQPKFQSGYSLRDALEIIDDLRFGSQADKHELSSLYEDKIKRMGNAGRNGGEYYTPRPLIRAMIQVVKPKIGERIYDGACGSAGFLCEAYEHMLPQAESTADRETLQRRTFYGKEKKSLAYVIAIMNMILHGIDTPNILHTNTLSENVLDIQEKHRFDVVLANPPFGGGERAEVQQNFPIRSGETAYLFLQHFMRSLRAGGRAAVVIKNTFLSNTDGAATALRRELVETCDLHTILDVPRGAFQGTGERVAVLFFEKGKPTRDIWYYQLAPGRSLGKTEPLGDHDLAEFVCTQTQRPVTPKSWVVDLKSVDRESWSLAVRNPSPDVQDAPRKPLKILEDIAGIEEELGRQLKGFLLPPVAGEKSTRVGDILTLRYGKPLPPGDRSSGGSYAVYGANGIKSRSDVFMCDGRTVIVGRKGSAGQITLSEEKFWPLDVTYYVEFDRERHDLIYIYYMLQSLNLPRLARGIKPGINRDEVYAEEVYAPPKDIQVNIVAGLVAALDKLENARRTLQSGMQALDELRAAILWRTFEGDFT